MKYALRYAIAAIATAATFGASGADVASQACTLISAAQINAALGTRLAAGKPIVTRCSYRSPDGKQEAFTEILAAKEKADATNALRMYHRMRSQEAAAGKKIDGVFTEMKAFPEGGELAYVLSGPDEVRLQFVVDIHLVTFSTKGIDSAKVKSQIGEIYKALKPNVR